jgi:hypothetical protein
MNMLYGENLEKMQEWEIILELALAESLKDDG